MGGGNPSPHQRKAKPGETPVRAGNRPRPLMSQPEMGGKTMEKKKLCSLQPGEECPGVGYTRACPKSERWDRLCPLLMALGEGVGGYSSVVISSATEEIMEVSRLGSEMVFQGEERILKALDIIKREMEYRQQ